MQVRNVDEPARLIVGVVAPYDAVSYLVPDPAGERIIRGAFGKSIRERGGKIPLCVAHDHAHPIGLSTEWADGEDGLTGTFRVKHGQRGDEALSDARDGLFSGMSVGFHPVRQTRDSRGVLEVREAKLGEVSLVLMAAYPGAAVLAVRNAQDWAKMMEPFANPPAVDLSPIPAVWAYDAPR